MFLEIVTPEAILFSSEIDSISVPGVNGEFQMLNNHAPIVSVLKEGTVNIHVHTQEHLELDELSGKLVPHADDDKGSPLLSLLKGHPLTTTNTAPSHSLLLATATVKNPPRRQRATSPSLW